MRIREVVDLGHLEVVDRVRLGLAVGRGEFAHREGRLCRPHTGEWRYKCCEKEGKMTDKGKDEGARQAAAPKSATSAINCGALESPAS